jgi:hypothetical protein
MIMKKFFWLIILITIAGSVNAQQKQDTVMIELAKTSRVIFTMRDKSDVEILKHYDFNELFKEILKKLEARDTTAIANNDSAKAETTVVPSEQEEDWSVNNDDEEENDDDDHGYHRRRGHTEQSFNFDLGTNNFLEKGKFPNSENANYAVRPWGSWYIGLASIQRTRLARNFFLEWGMGVSWYNFKFEKDNIVIQKDDNGLQFLEDNREVDFKKSKLTVSYITASIVPVIDFSNSSDKSRMWDNDGSAFRFGIGPYVGYRIGSHTKLVYEEDGDREKDKNKDSFYLNNFRYGARLQFGYRSTDFFFNYDLNELFSAGKAPKLNAFSFGVIF